MEYIGWYVSYNSQYSYLLCETDRLTDNLYELTHASSSCCVHGNLRERLKYSVIVTTCNSFKFGYSAYHHWILFHETKTKQSTFCDYDPNVVTVYRSARGIEFHTTLFKM